MTTLNTEAGRATAKLKPSDNLALILAKLLKAHPDASDEELYNEFKELTGFNTAVVRKAALFGPMIRESFLFNLGKLRPVAKALGGITKLEPRVKEQRRDERKATQERILGAAASLVRDASLRLLETVLPTGKTLAASTFSECAQVAGWMSKLGTKGKPNELVGDVLTEKQVRAFFDTHAGK